MGGAMIYCIPPRPSPLPTSNTFADLPAPLLLTGRPRLAERLIVPHAQMGHPVINAPHLRQEPRPPGPAGRLRTMLLDEGQVGLEGPLPIGKM